MANLAAILSRFTKQSLVYWRRDGVDGYGKTTYKDPVELKCRVEQKAQELVTADGRRVISKGYLLLASSIEVGGLVYVGTIAQWKLTPSYPDPPSVNDGGSEIMIVAATPDINAQSFVYEAYL